MSVLADDELAADPPPIASEPAHGDAGAAGWEKDGRGRYYVKPPEGGNVVFRRGEETVAEALERAARPDKDKKPPPKPRKKAMPKREAVDLKAIEEAIGQVFAAPGQVAGMMLQDEWIMAHFMVRGPELARALCNASEHNPWLRKKLIEISTGGAAAMQLQAFVMLAIASASYAIPPAAYLLGFNDRIPTFVQVSVLGGPIPTRAQPARPGNPIVAENPAGGDISYGEGSAQAA
jgi:hypothetical protein